MTNEMCVYHSGMTAQFDAICKKLEMIEKNISKQIDMQEKSVLIAKQEMERRLEGMNEFRAQLAQQATTFISKAEVTLLFEKVEAHFEGLAKNNRERIDMLDKLYSEKTAAKKWSDHIVTVLIGMAVLVVIWIMQHGIK